MEAWRARHGSLLLRQLQIIHYPIHRQFAERDQLRDPQQRPALRCWQEAGEVLGDGFGRGECYAGISRLTKGVAAIRGLADQDFRTRRTEVPHAKPP